MFSKIAKFRFRQLAPSTRIRISVHEKLSQPPHNPSTLHQNNPEIFGRISSNFKKDYPAQFGLYP